MSHNLDHTPAVAKSDVDALAKAFKSYGDSWRKRGGVGAFMMLARKWDRLENHLNNPKPAGIGKETFSRFDIFEAIRLDKRAEGIIDDIRDLRRYLMLVEAEMMTEGIVPAEVKKDAPEEDSKFSTGPVPAHESADDVGDANHGTLTFFNGGLSYARASSAVLAALQADGFLVRMSTVERVIWALEHEYRTANNARPRR